MPSLRSFDNLTPNSTSTCSGGRAAERTAPCTRSSTEPSGWSASRNASPVVREASRNRPTATTSPAPSGRSAPPPPPEPPGPPVPDRDDGEGDGEGEGDADSRSNTCSSTDVPSLRATSVKPVMPDTLAPHGHRGKSGPTPAIRSRTRTPRPAPRRTRHPRAPAPARASVHRPQERPTKAGPRPNDRPGPMRRNPGAPDPAPQNPDRQDPPRYDPGRRVVWWALRPLTPRFHALQCEPRARTTHGTAPTALRTSAPARTARPPTTPPAGGHGPPTRGPGSRATGSATSCRLGRAGVPLPPPGARPTLRGSWWGPFTHGRAPRWRGRRARAGSHRSIPRGILTTPHRGRLRVLTADGAPYPPAGLRPWSCR